MIFLGSRNPTRRSKRKGNGSSSVQRPPVATSQTRQRPRQGNAPGRRCYSAISSHHIASILSHRCPPSHISMIMEAAGGSTVWSSEREGHTYLLNGLCEFRRRFAAHEADRAVAVAVAKGTFGEHSELNVRIQPYQFRPYKRSELQCRWCFCGSGCEIMKAKGSDLDIHVRVPKTRGIVNCLNN
jgi:hypothetical protein